MFQTSPSARCLICGIRRPVGSRLALAGWVVLGLILMTLSGWAQSSQTGSLRGVVQDPTQAVVRGAKVTLTSAQTGVQLSVFSNEQGIYVFPFLAPGTYSASVTAAGFLQAQPITLKLVESPLVHDFLLKVDVVRESVRVTPQQGTALIQTDTNAFRTTTAITPEGVSQLGGAQISPYKVLAVLPSVNYESADAFAMTNNQSIRVRGQIYIGSTVEGMSLMNSGLDPGVADRWLFDMENLSEVSLAQGGTPAEVNMIPYNPGSTMDRRILWPLENRGLTVKEYSGSNNFNKVFARVDSGILSSKTALFASYSHTVADKWKGKGDSRVNIATFTVQQQVTPSIKVRLAASYSQPQTHSYRSLSYAQARNLANYNGYEYNSTLLKNATQDINYFNYNRDSFTSWAVFGIANASLGKIGKVTVKPYFVSERGYILAGVGNLLGSAGIREWQILHNMFGVEAQYDVHVGAVDLSAGYWYSAQEAPGPPTAQKVYRATSSGSLNFAGWSTLAKFTEKHTWNAPYVSVGWHGGRWMAKGQLRYVSERLPSFVTYNGSTTVNTSYSEALKYGTVNSAGSAHGHQMQELLPFLGINYRATKQLGVYASYGRNFGRAAFSSSSTYAENSAIFAANGLTEQYLWDKVRPETSDNVDLGAHYDTKTWNVSLVAFDSISNHRVVSVSDPKLGGLAYMQNIARAVSRGAEVKIVKEVAGAFDIFATASRNKFMFTHDIVTATNTVADAKGKQVPDVPSYMATIGLTYRFCDIAISPLARYIGQRYGDVTNVERIPSYATMDLDMHYTHALPAKGRKLEAGTNFFNLFNRRYIGMMNVSDDTKQGAASYYAAAPRTVMGEIQLRF